MRVIHVPMSEMLWPAKKSRKLRCRSARHACEIPARPPVFCGLDSPDRHVARVRARVMAGGHDISEAKIRERFPVALEHLIELMPHLARLQVYDNSVEVAVGKPIPDPRLLADVIAGRLAWPRDAATLRGTPHWAKAILEAALSLGE